MIKKIYGTKDILPSEITKWNILEEIVRKSFNAFNYKEIRTPIFEETQLFSRSIGESTDIVSKEMYTFTDRSDTSITLKPEMTASVVRSVLEHSLDKQYQLNKLFYISPMFRQERPQAGRLRQFHQFGAEAIGISEPSLDAEIIILSYDILKQLGLKKLAVKINSLGIPESREKYKTILKEFLSGHSKYLSEESRKRMNTNILRVFDSKDDGDIKVMENAPLLLEHLDENSLENFEKVKELLLLSKIPFEIDPRLVRGLDYYTHTTFEILSESVGAQSALCGGGRYDLLAQEIGDRPVPGTGFAAGIERILLACENEKSLSVEDEVLDLYIVRLENELFKKVFELGLQLRKDGLKIEFDYSSRSVKAQMREANKLNAKWSLLIGGDEYKSGKVVLKNMSSGDQQEIMPEDISKIKERVKE